VEGSPVAVCPAVVQQTLRPRKAWVAQERLTCFFSQQHARLLCVDKHRSAVSELRAAMLRNTIENFF